jgi:ABC-type multidrug transport system fused ATPase/permease subunit
MFCVPGINDTYNNFRQVRNDENMRMRHDAKQADNPGVKYGFNDRISIEDVTWKYPNSENIVLDHISIEILKGQSVAFVGKSGAGKTTLSDVILGLLTPQSGRVTVDGVDIDKVLEQKGHIIGFVPQSVNLLDDTVRRNVAFGLDDNVIDDALVWSALEQAQLKDIIMESANGLDTQIGERGIKFSGGQRQRFAIARALYNEPEILILDEATSALDTETETAVMESIESLQGHKTLIIIAHRLTTIRNCDKIYRIEEGRATECRYEELD